MDQATLANDESSDILTLAFNQDYTSLGVGHKRGYKFFSLGKVPEQLEETYAYECDGVHLVERLFQSSLVTLCTHASPRKMRVFHMRQKDDICAYNYSNSVLAIRMNRQRLVVVLEDSVHIHHIRDLKILHAIRDTPRNPTGLSALSPNTENCFLAYPGSATVGEVQIFDAANLSAVAMIPAHEHALAALAFDAAGTRLATASDVGTVIRLFAVPSGAKLAEFSRGLARSVLIASVAFSADSRFLAVSSNTETVHVFQVADAPGSVRASEPPQAHEEVASGADAGGASWGGYFTRVLKYPLSYLPTPLGEVWNRDRDFATARLPRAGVRNVCAIVPIGGPPRQVSSGSSNESASFPTAKELLLLVASYDGFLFCFKLDAVNGGECALLYTFRLGDQTIEIPTTPTSPSAAGRARALTTPIQPQIAPVSRRGETISIAGTTPPVSIDSNASYSSTGLSRSPPSAVPGQNVANRKDASDATYDKAAKIGQSSRNEESDPDIDKDAEPNLLDPAPLALSD